MFLSLLLSSSQDVLVPFHPPFLSLPTLTPPLCKQRWRFKGPSIQLSQLFPWSVQPPPPACSVILCAMMMWVSAGSISQRSSGSKSHRDRVMRLFSHTQCHFGGWSFFSRPSPQPSKVLHPAQHSKHWPKGDGGRPHKRSLRLRTLTQLCSYPLYLCHPRQQETELSALGLAVKSRPAEGNGTSKSPYLHHLCPGKMQGVFFLFSATIYF